MKRTILLISVLLSIMTVKAQQWQSISGEGESAFKTKLLSSSENKISIDFAMSGFYSKTVNTPRGEALIISALEMAPLSEQGSPDLPLTAIPVVIGDFAEMDIQIISSQFTDYHNISVAPSKGDISRTVNPDDVPYLYGDMYGKDVFYPESQARLETPYILRDLRGQNIMLCPFSYNDESKTLRVYHHIVLEMNKISNKGINPKTSRKNSKISVDSEIGKAYRDRFINFGDSKYDFIEDEGSLLIIAPETYISGLEEFATWKRHSGRPTHIVSTAETGITADEVKDYISRYYEENRDLTHILLVGDFDDIKPKYISNGNYSGYSDNYFGMLEGDDFYIEAFVGRFSVESAEDLENQVNKVLYYERDITGEVTWLNKGIGIAADNGSGHFGESDSDHIDLIRDTLMHYSYVSVSQQYEDVGNGTDASLISADFNEGVGICNYAQHGTATSWSVGFYSNDDINALTNDYKWPFIWSTACDNGQFNNITGPCFAETWMRATNSTTGAPTGAIGGMFSYIAQPWIPPMTGQDNMVSILTGWESDKYKHTLGGASLNGNMKILDLHPNDGGRGTHNSWILFGDPSLMLRTDNPTEMNVVCQPNSLTIGDKELIVTAEADYGIATLIFEGEVIGSAVITNRTATINFEALQEEGTLSLVVTGYNRVTYSGSIMVRKPESVDENAIGEAEIYPNPSEGTIFVRSGMKDFDYTVYNIQGQALMAGSVHICGSETAIDMSKIGKATYFIDIQGVEIIRKKIVIK